MVEAEPSLSHKRDYIMIRLLDACVNALSEQGMERVFVDAIREGGEGFQATGRVSYDSETPDPCADVGVQVFENGRRTRTYGGKRNFIYALGAAVHRALIPESTPAFLRRRDYCR